MVLLVVLTLGMISLSSFAIRTSAVGSAEREAKANARLAAIMALGELQKLTGPDTRVTASSTLLSNSNALATGVWRSWEGSDHDISSGPLAEKWAPKYDLKNVAGDPGDLIANPDDGRFLGWLTSTASGLAPDPNDIPGLESSAQKASKKGYVPLVSTGSVDEAARVDEPSEEVYIRPTLVNGGRGSFAWWTSGENSKAMINTDRGEKPQSTVEWQERVKSDGRPDPGVFDLGQVDVLPSGAFIPSAETLGLLVDPSASSTPDLKKFHHLTAYNRGLLTNTATGGWRRDLSLFSEGYDSLPEGGLRLFTREPGEFQTYSRVVPGTRPSDALLYPWSDYSLSPSHGWYSGQSPPICSWSALVDYMLQYKNLTTSTAPRTAMGSHVGGYVKSGGSKRYDFHDRVRRSPQIARIQWVFSLCSIKIEATETEPAAYKAALMITPVLTLWNPYNVELRINNFGTQFQHIAPLRLTFKVGDQEYSPVSLAEIMGTQAGRYRYTADLRVNQPIVLPAGGTRIFSYNGNPQVVTGQTSRRVLYLTPGYRNQSGYVFTALKAGGSEIVAAPSDQLSITKVSYDEPGRGSRSGLGIMAGVYANSYSSNNERGYHRYLFDLARLGGQSVLDQLWPPLQEDISVAQIQTVALPKSQPFCSATLFNRLVSPPPADPIRHRYLFTKGLLMTNPLCYLTNSGDGGSDVTLEAGFGFAHPVNVPLDFAFDDVNSWNQTDLIPQFDHGSNATYIVSGLGVGDGLTRCVIAELPTRPLQSLAELQHFDASNNVPAPPYQFNLIGNGSAHPLIAPDKLSTGYFRGNDNSYLLNHMLFDDWFVSSIARDLKDFDKTEDRSIKTVYQDHLEGKAPLPNRFYLPAAGADLPNASTAAAEATSSLEDPETEMFPFESIASKLEVEGMFNINSVSIEAWKAILRQGRELKVPYLDSKGATQTDGEVSYAYPRSSIAGDRLAGSGGNESNPLFGQADEVAGYRALTDKQIDALAEEIVKEIRKRGPFLSLSEFVNRRVSYQDQDLAIASTIQKALDNLALRNDETNPFATLQQLGVEITETPPGKTDYKFPEAAYGSSLFGVPGWVRQADILRPIAPVITARDDTFVIRAYGDSRDRADNSKVLARAWCEMVVRRKADYVDPIDKSEIPPHSPMMTSEINKRFGRRYAVVSFRWLSEDEI